MTPFSGLTKVAGLTIGGLTGGLLIEVDVGVGTSVGDVVRELAVLESGVGPAVTKGAGAAAAGEIAAFVKCGVGGLDNSGDLRPVP